MEAPLDPAAQVTLGHILEIVFNTVFSGLIVGYFKSKMEKTNKEAEEYQRLKFTHLAEAVEEVKKEVVWVKHLALTTDKRVELGVTKTAVLQKQVEMMDERMKEIGRTTEDLRKTNFGKVLRRD